MTFIEALNWRYAVKRMNGREVPQEKVDRILEAIRLSASSMGLQPYTILSIKDSEVRKELQPAAYNQPQVVESSHLLVFAAWSFLSKEDVERYIQQISDVRKVSLESLQDFRSSLMGLVENKTPEQQAEWAARQVYIALGTALSAAALEQVDSTPMEGFQPDRVDAILGLPEKNLRSVALLALGYRDNKQDFLAGAKKVRRDIKDLVLEVRTTNGHQSERKPEKQLVL